MESRSINVLVCHVPSRPVDCLVRTLDALRFASDRCSVIVEVVVQGPCDHELPPNVIDIKDDFSVHFTHNKLNTGVARPLTEHTQSWLAIRGDYWAKVDDDVVLCRGAFDMMLDAIAEANRAGLNPACCQMDVGGIRSTLLSSSKEVLIRMQGAHGSFHNKKWSAFVCDAVGTGSTIFTRRAFDAGCRFEPSYIIGGVDIDMSWQMTQKDLRSVIVRSHGNLHDLERCSPAEYHKVRWNRSSISKSGEIFKNRWGIEDPRLRS